MSVDNNIKDFRSAARIESGAQSGWAHFPERKHAPDANKGDANPQTTGMKRKKKQGYMVTTESPGSARVMAALRDGDLSVDQIAERAHLSRNSVRNHYLRVLHAANWIYVCGWVRSSRGPATPIYRLGSGEDAPRPARLDSDRDYKRQRCREWKERSGYNAANRALHRLCHPDQALAALLGIRRSA